MAKLAPPPPNTQDVNSKQYKDWLYSVYALFNQGQGALGSMAYENSNNVAISGGSIGGVNMTGDTINNSQIGNITPATIKGTTITATSQFNGSGAGLTGIPYTAITGGYTGTITTAKLTSGGTNGSMTFSNGILTAQTQAT